MLNALLGEILIKCLEYLLLLIISVSSTMPKIIEITGAFYRETSNNVSSLKWDIDLVQTREIQIQIF